LIRRYRTLCLLAAIGSLFASPFVLAGESRFSDDVHRYVWDLSSLVPSDAAWEEERAAVAKKLETIGRLRGTLGANARALAAGLDEIAELRRSAGRLELYGVLRTDADIKSEKAARMAAAGPALANQVDSATGFAGDEIRSTGEKRIEEWLKSEPRLEVHRRRIHQALRDGPHVSALGSQALLGELADWPDGLARTYWALLESDLPWPTMTGADGSEVVVNNTAFLRLRNSTNPGERRKATELFFRRLAPLEDVFGVLLTRRIQADATIARQRRFRDGIEAQLFREGLPPDAHRAMLAVVHSSLPLLHRYLRLRSRALGLTGATFDTIRVPPPGGEKRITAGQSLSAIVAASAPLGEEFQAKMRESLAKPWVHQPPSPTKRDTYEIFPGAGGARPFGLMTFRDDLASSRALAGLATLMVTFAAVPPERSFDRWEEDTGVFSNGILEAGRFLHDDYVIDHADGRTERIAALVNAVDSLGGAFFRYAMASEFESAVQEAVLRGEAPSGRQLTETYLSLLRKYYGHETGVIDVDEIFGREWITNRVSFISFEMLNFPLAAAAAASLVEKARAADGSARSAFLHALGRGEIDLSSELLKNAGVDLATAGPYEAVGRRMNGLIARLERQLDNGQ